MKTQDVDFARIDRDAALAGAAATSTQSQALIPAGAGAVQERSFGAQRVAVYRDEARILQKLKALAQAAGEDYFYRFPVFNKKENRTDFIEGGSIKLANDLARIYGNCDIDTRVVDQGDSWLFYARFTDFETGFSQTRAFQQRKGQSAMKTDAGRAADIAFQIGQSKAIRNVVLNSLQTFADFTFEEARSSLVTRIGARIDHFRDRLLTRFGELGIALPRVQAVIGKAPADWVAPDVAKLIAMVKSITDNMATASETFPELGVPANPSERHLKADLDAIAAAGNGALAHNQSTGEIISQELQDRAVEAAKIEIGEAMKHQAPVSGDPPADTSLEPFDAHTRVDELLSDGRAAATNGAKAFKTWHARLNAQDAEMMQPYADGLKKVAVKADEVRR